MGADGYCRCSSLVIFTRVVFSLLFLPFTPISLFSFFLTIASTTQRIPFLLFALLQQSKQVTQDPDYCLVPSWFILFILCHAWRPLSSSLEVRQQWFIKEVQIQINGLDTLVACVIFEVVKRSTVVYIPKIRGKFAVAVSSYLSNSFNSQLPDPTTVEMQTPTHVELCTKPIK